MELDGYLPVNPIEDFGAFVLQSVIDDIWKSVSLGYGNQENAAVTMPAREQASGAGVLDTIPPQKPTFVYSQPAMSSGVQRQQYLQRRPRQLASSQMTHFSGTLCGVDGTERRLQQHDSSIVTPLNVSTASQFHTQTGREMVDGLTTISTASLGDLVTNPLALECATTATQEPESRRATVVAAAVSVDSAGLRYAPLRAVHFVCRSDNYAHILTNCSTALARCRSH